MQSPNLRPFAAQGAIDPAAYNRFVRFDDETRLHRIHDGLSGLRDLCLESHGGTVKIDQLGYLIAIAGCDLASAFAGEDDDRVPFNALKVEANEHRINRIRDGVAALRDLCVSSRADFVKIEQIGYLIDLIVRDLEQVALGERSGHEALLGNQP